MALQQQNFDPIVNAKSQLSNKHRGWSQKARESALDRISKIGLPSLFDKQKRFGKPIFATADTRLIIFPLL